MSHPTAPATPIPPHLFTLFLFLLSSSLAVAAEKPMEVSWYTNYSKAMAVAEKQGKMMFVFFAQPGKNKLRDHMESVVLADPEVRRKLQKYVCTKLLTDTKIRVKGNQVTVLDHAAFQKMQGKQGVAILDFANPKNPETYGRVVSAFPLTAEHKYSARQMRVILDLPPGTITQRTLIFAIRIHPDHPASTDGRLHPFLVAEAKRHSQHQARIRLQGHHHWNSRFHRINARLSSGLTACEVCAESWPGQNLVAAAIECVRCWRLSSGHWSAVRARQHSYGYDMKSGSNGVWYATGIFGRKGQSLAQSL